MPFGEGANNRKGGENLRDMGFLELEGGESPAVQLPVHVEWTMSNDLDNR